MHLLQGEILSTGRSGQIRSTGKIGRVRSINGMANEGDDVFGREAVFGIRSATGRICRDQKSPGMSRRTKLTLILLALQALSIYLCWLKWSESLYWHASAIGRILMIKALPFWNWTPLFYRRCLVGKTPMEELKTSLTLSDCAVCESISNIKHVSNVDYETMFDQHLIRGAPVIVTDARTDSDSQANLTRILSEDNRLRDSVPCVLQTNLRAGRQPTDLAGLLEKIASLKVPEWFVHFQNCDLQAVKSLRTLAPRPYFLSPHIPPAHFNWLIMSHKYSAPRYKPLELDPGLIVLSQLKGTNSIRLTPRNPCEDSCPSLKFDVRKGETLVLPNSMWNFEYIPDESAENVAILTETAWNEA